MDLDLDLTHRTVLIVGDAASARLAVARYRHAAAAVSLTIGADLTTVAGCRGVDYDGNDFTRLLRRRA